MLCFVRTDNLTSDLALAYWKYPDIKSRCINENKNTLNYYPQMIFEHTSLKLSLHF